MDIFGLMLEPMARGAAQSVGAWAAKKAIKMLQDCCYCDERKTPCVIENVARNELYCPNCRKESKQFVSVCDFTVRPNGQIGQIGMELSSNYDYSKDWWGTRTHVYVRGEYLFKGLKGQSVVETNTMSDYETGEEFTSVDTIWSITDDHDVRGMRLIAPLSSVPGSKFYGKIICLDTHIRSKYRDLLFTDRDLIRPKPF